MTQYSMAVTVCVCLTVEANSDEKAVAKAKALIESLFKGAPVDGVGAVYDLNVFRNNRAAVKTEE